MCIYFIGDNMKTVRDVREYLFKEQLEIRLYIDKVDIINYKKIGIIESDKVFVYHSKGLIKVFGSDLVITKLYNNEVLINGKIEKIELGD